MDEMEKDAKTGKNEDFGFYVNRKFYIRSRLPMQRLLKAQGHQIYQQDWNDGEIYQFQWIFDAVTKTISTVHYKTGLRIENEGKSDKIRTQGGIFSRWWEMFRYDGNYITNEHGKVIGIQGQQDNNRQLI
jgi:hypothetical protein